MIVNEHSRHSQTLRDANCRSDARQKGSFYFIRLKNTKPAGTGGKMVKGIQEKAGQRSEMTKGSRERTGNRAPRQGRKEAPEDKTSHLMTIFWRKARGPEPGRGSGGGGPGPRAEAAGGSPWAVMYFL